MMKNMIRCFAVLAVVASVTSHRLEGSIENPSLREYYHLGGYYMNTEQYELAIADFRALTERHPTTRESEHAWLGMGEGYFRLMLRARDDLAKARAEGRATKKEVEGFESKIKAHMNQAIAAYQKVIAQFPASRADAILRVGLVYLACGTDKGDEAIGEFQKVIAGFPEEAGRAQILLADLYAEMGDAEKARAAYTIAANYFPEVSSLAMLSYADYLTKLESYGEAVDSYDMITGQLGIDGAYDSVHRPIGHIMREAVQKRGRAERALKSKDDELKGYTGVASRYYGTNTAMEANMALAEALGYYGRGSEAVSMLKSIATGYPRSVWAPKALMQLGSLQGVSRDAVETYRGIMQSYPASIYWIDAQMKLAALYLKLADTEKDADEKARLKAHAGDACRAVVSAFPLCPEGEAAKSFIAEHKL